MDSVKPQNTKPQKYVRNSFDVTCVVGTVKWDDASPETFTEAAFKLIAQHSAQGTFTFPVPGGGSIRVTVEYE